MHPGASPAFVQRNDLIVEASLSAGYGSILIYFFSSSVGRGKISPHFHVFSYASCVDVHVCMPAKHAVEPATTPADLELPHQWLDGWRQG